MDKDEIMAGYLNTAYYGRGAYGIQAAARTYYGKDAEDLNAERVRLPGRAAEGRDLLRPGGCDGHRPGAPRGGQHQRAKERWSWILDEMVKDGHLTRDRARQVSPELPDARRARGEAELSGQIGYLVDLAKTTSSTTPKASATTKLRQGGYEIHTTFDKKKVNELENAVKKVRKANIEPKKRPETDKHVQFGGASVEPDDGAIVAIYGGEDATKHFTNNADRPAPGRFDVQAVRAGRGDAVTASGPELGGPGTGRAHDGLAGERLQRQEQAQDQELRRQRLAEREGKEWLQTQRRRRVVRAPTTSTCARP